MKERKGIVINNLWVKIGAVFILILLIGGWINKGKIWRYIIKEERQKQEELKATIEEQDELIIALSDSLDEQSERIEVEKIYIDEYKDDYIREYNKRIKLEKAMDSILFARYGRSYLDSLSEHVRYR